MLVVNIQPIADALGRRDGMLPDIDTYRAQTRLA